MISIKGLTQEKRNQGFTIVELLIVIVVIGILALLVITTYSGIQSKARNSKRSSDVKSIQTHLEAYFSGPGNYPSRADMNNPTWRATNMKSIEPGALKDPSAPTCDPTDATKPCLVGAPAAKAYAYVPTDSTGSSANCEADDTTCSKYTLTATFEGSVNGATTSVAKNLDGS